MTRTQPGSTDAHALRLIHTGRIVADPTTGVILVDGTPRGYTSSSGYTRIVAAGVYLQSHRVVWLYCHGPIPPGHVINHRDGNRRNNRIANLEAVTPRQNALHARRSPNYRGTYPDQLAPDLTDGRTVATTSHPDGTLEHLMQTVHDTEPRHARPLH